MYSSARVLRELAIATDSERESRVFTTPAWLPSAPETKHPFRNDDWTVEDLEAVLSASAVVVRLAGPIDGIGYDFFKRCPATWPYFSFSSTSPSLVVNLPGRVPKFGVIRLLLKGGAR